MCLIGKLDDPADFSSSLFIYMALNAKKNCKQSKDKRLILIWNALYHYNVVVVFVLHNVSNWKAVKRQMSSQRLTPINLFTGQSYKIYHFSFSVLRFVLHYIIIIQLWPYNYWKGDNYYMKIWSHACQQYLICKSESVLFFSLYCPAVV